jgi:hypothetical protein
MATRNVQAHLNTCDYSDCRHEWVTRDVPARCARCKRRTWNKGGDRGTPSPASAKPQKRRAQMPHTALVGASTMGMHYQIRATPQRGAGCPITTHPSGCICPFGVREIVSIQA